MMSCSTAIGTHVELEHLSLVITICSLEAYEVLALKS